MDRRKELVRFDWAIKRILRDKANFGVLEGFLSVVLKDDVKIVEILESESNKQSDDDKFNRVDIKARNSKDEIIIVEVQNTREADYLLRILYGVAKTMTEHLYSGDPYGKIQKVYSISILYFDLGQGDDYAYRGQTEFRGIHTDDELTLTEKERAIMGFMQPREVFPEYYLLMVEDFDKVAATPLEEWISYLKTGEISEDAKAPGLQEAREKLRLISMSKEDQNAYEKYLHDEASFLYTQKVEKEYAHAEGKAEGLAEGRAEGLVEGRAEGLAEGRVKGLVEGRAEGLAEGRAEGLAEGRVKGLVEGRAEGLAEGRAEGAQNEKKIIAANMKHMGLSTDVISQSTGLSADEIDNL